MPPDLISREAAGAEAARRPSPALAIRVNGEPRTVPAGCSVASLLALLAVERRRVAVAINREVVPRSALDSRTLAAGDRVEILEAVGGG